MQNSMRSLRRTESNIMLWSKGDILGRGGEHSAYIVHRSAQDAYLPEARLMAAAATARVRGGTPDASLVMLGRCTGICMP